MATNPASYNPIGEETGPVTEAPPPLPQSTTDAIAGSAESSATGTHVPGASAAPKVKSEKELERERKKAEKQAKFDQKKAKSGPATGISKTAEKKANAKKSEEDAIPIYVEDTPPGEKKILKSLETDPNFKAYNPIAVESAWNAWWEKEGFFKPEFTADGKVKEEGSFVIVVPPPNVTGALHMGHALGNALQDVMIRWNRMQGKTTLWLPGCDHAGIATQSVVENMLWKKEKKTRHDLGRQKFVERVWEWKEDYHKRINDVQRRMGGSFDWNREAFTMNETFTAAVTETFVTLHEEGLIYRDNKLVQWCTQLNTALSSLEVDKKELKGRTLIDVPGYDKKVEFGVIVSFKYPIKDSDETITVATTRIETMLGDSGIAVHPDDERYTHLIGKYAQHPFIEDRLLPIIADTYVERDFGTGAVKLTPAHDENDYNLGKKHQLQFINILTDDGKMNENAGPYAGQKRFDVRYTIQDDLKKMGLYVEKKDNEMIIPVCSKSKDVIEPLLKPQWYMKMKDMAAEALNAVTSGQIKVLPEKSEKSYIKWMSNVNDWCLSRQLWWGHQAPMYLAHIDGELKSDGVDGTMWFSGRTIEEAEKKAKASEVLAGKKFTLTRDEDVLDTWFSSGLWPFATLGWPNKDAPDLQRLFPTSVLETGWDILFFWIARMIMFSLKLTGKVPFTEVYCHSLIRDSEHRKMSKSLGNVIDPVDVIQGIALEGLQAKLLAGNLAAGEVEKATKYQKTAFPNGIPECGTDALRFALVNYTTGGEDIAFDVQIIYSYRTFCNKILQATRYFLGQLPADYIPRKTGALTGKESLAERWILHNLTTTAKEVNQALAAREFSKSTSAIQQYWRSQLCDVYIENSKALIRDGTDEEKRSALDTLYTAVEGGLTLIHPFMPFISEELWQHLPRRPEDKIPSIVLAKYPIYNAEMDDPASVDAYELVMGVSGGIRSLMSGYGIKTQAKIFIQTFTPTALSTTTKQLQSIKALTKDEKTITLLTSSDARPPGCVSYTVSTTATVFLHVKDSIDLNAEKSKAEKKLEKVEKNIKAIEKVIGMHQKKLSEGGEDSSKIKDLLESESNKLKETEAEKRGIDGTIKEFEEMKLED